MIEALVGTPGISDIAIDDLILHDRYCKVEPPPTTAAPVPPTSTFVCEGGQFQCDRNKCIPSSWVCDGRFDCDDRTDEIDCPGLKHQSTVISLKIS